MIETGQFRDGAQRGLRDQSCTQEELFVRQKAAIAYLESEFGVEYPTFFLSLLTELGFVDEMSLPTIHVPPLPHRGSDALYLAEYSHKDDMVFLSILLPHSKTSFHYHEDPMYEEYHPISGSGYLRNTRQKGDGGRLIPMSEERVGPFLEHQVVTREESAVMLILLRNARLVSRDRHHIYSGNSSTQTE